MANPVIHFEIFGTEGDKLRSFYTDLFGWKIQTLPPPGNEYGIVEAEEGNAGKGIGGAVAQSDNGTSAIYFYVAVDDPQAYLDRAVSMGGEVTQPVVEIPGVVTFARFRDPQGNVIGLVKDTDG